MKFMNLYFYTFYRLYQRLQINPWGNINYYLSLITLVVLEVWVLHCLLGDVALVVGEHIINDNIIAFSLPAAFLLASIFTYITIYQYKRGHQCVIIFDRWPKERHRLARWLVRFIGVLFVLDTMYLLST
jgi:hypothetical protein